MSVLSMALLSPILTTAYIPSKDDGPQVFSQARFSLLLAGEPHAHSEHEECEGLPRLVPHVGCF